MTHVRSVIGAIAIAISVGLSATLPALAQNYPTKPVRVIVGFAPGGGGDILSRAFASEMEKALGQPFLVENRPGANGLVAAGQLAKLPADGYTLGMTVPAVFTNALLVPNTPYKVPNDFQPIGMMATTPMLLVVHPKVQANSVKEFIALAKASPGKVNYAGAGNASTVHLFMELLNYKAGIQTTHIPYGGGGPGMASTVAGDTDVTWVSTVQGLPLVNAGKLKVLAVSTAQRIKSLPNVPTMIEAGVPGFAVDVWFGYHAPAGTPRPIVERLNAEMNRIARTPDMLARIDKLGAVPMYGSAEDFAAVQKAEVDRWTELFKHVTIKVE